MTALQTHTTSPLASPIWSFFSEIFCCFRSHFVLVDLTGKGQGVSDVPTCFQIGYNFAPNVAVFREKSKVSNAVETFSGTRKRHTSAIFNLDEANFFVFVAAHKRKKNDVTFFALKVVHGRQAYVLQFFTFIRLETVSNGKHLPCVGRQKSYLIGRVSLL